ncbi:TetR/AcrR family transcriptional regulator [candidate division WOR-3 bacterium]|nr:TetR/AcrR family transcriptional regulator [candidate division WOR-3 bacterium]
MKEDKKIEAKKRIFDTAVRLFARKGYAAVGIREIAKEANVQISMINYYYDGKISILKSIMDEYYTKYGEATSTTGDEKTPLDERVKTMIRNMVTFHRENADLANATFCAIPVDIPEIIDYRIKWFESSRKKADELFRILGLDPNDVIQTAVLKGMLGSIIGNFFRSRYCCDRMAEEPNPSEHVKEHFKHDDHSIPLDDAFFEKYIDCLTSVYLYGITNLSKKK